MESPRSAPLSFSPVPLPFLSISLLSLSCSKTNRQLKNNSRNKAKTNEYRTKGKRKDPKKKHKERIQAQNHTCLHIINTQSWKTMYTHNDCKIKVKKSLAKHYKTKNFQKKLPLSLFLVGIDCWAWGLYNTCNDTCKDMATWKDRVSCTITLYQSQFYKLVLTEI